MQRCRLLNMDHAVCADYEMLSAAVEACKGPNMSGNYHVGKIFTSDFFYHPQEKNLFPLLKKHEYLYADSFRLILG